MRWLDSTNINFINDRHIPLMVSGALVLISILSVFIQGLELGLDFTGGTAIEVAYPEAAIPKEIRSQLESAGLKGVQVQNFGSTKDILIRIPPPEKSEKHESQNEAKRVVETLKIKTPTLEIKRQEFVGPQVGSELVEKGSLALLITLIGILVYVGMRFEFRFSLGAIIALLHDVIMILGIFSIFRVEFDLTALGAILAIIGYSLNDTIVVFDRVRENFRKMRKASTLEVMNSAINQTLSRTIMTSFVTWLVVVILLIFGGETLFGFSLALVFGIITGTYSSIYIACDLAYLLKADASSFIKTRVERVIDDRP